LLGAQNRLIDAKREGIQETDRNDDDDRTLADMKKTVKKSGKNNDNNEHDQTEQRKLPNGPMAQRAHLPRPVGGQNRHFFGKGCVNNRRQNTKDNRKRQKGLEIAIGRNGQMAGQNGINKKIKKSAAKISNRQKKGAADEFIPKQLIQL
jgi:hypothetical protein